MKKLLFLIAICTMVGMMPMIAQQKVTGLSNVKLYLDPGHSMKENMGVHGYSEAEKALRVMLAVKEYLLEYTDMQEQNIRLCRTDDTQDVSLEARSDEANSWEADFFYSFHSDAGGTSSNSTLFLYGGRRLSQGATPIEKTPEGGKEYGDILNPNITGVLRVGTRGNINDLINYNSSSLTPYLSVNRRTNMASHLSESGFHTNPTQNMQFMNAEHKRMQAYAAYQSLVKFLSGKFGTTGTVNPVHIGIVTGIIKDDETGMPVNGATVTLTEGATVKTYTTDSYESLFNKYSINPDELGNGFYWVEGFTPGATVTVKVECEGFATQEKTVSVPTTIGASTKDGLGILDFQMVNEGTLAKVKRVKYTTDSYNKVIVNRPITITFNREMDKQSLEDAIVFTPEAPFILSWSSATETSGYPITIYNLNINISQLEFETDYELRIDGNIAKSVKTGKFLDGADNGTEGSDYILNFSTQTMSPPTVVSYDPQGDQEINQRPIVRLEFDRALNQASIAPNQIIVTDGTGKTVAGRQSYAEMNKKSVLHYIFNSDLTTGETYNVNLLPGVEDIYGEKMTEGFDFNFIVRPRTTTVNQVLQYFNSNTSPWNDWNTTTEGQTVGTDNDVVGPPRYAYDPNVLATVESTLSFRMDYKWLEGATNSFQRKASNNQDGSAVPNFTNKNILQYWLFGDGSNSKATVVLRCPNPGGYWHKTENILIDWVGWKLISWDLEKDANAAIWAGSGNIPASDLRMGGMFIDSAPLEIRLYEKSSIWWSGLRLVSMGDFENFTVKLDPRNGEPVESVTVPYESKVPCPEEAPVIAGNTFQGWFTEPECINEWICENDFVTHNITLYGKWENSYTVTFDPQNGGPEIKALFASDVKILPPAVVYEGYQIDGWFTQDDVEWDFDNDVLSGDLSLFAKWTLQIIQYTVTFDSQGGSNVTSVKVEPDAKISQPSNPTREGYSFDGWYKEAACTNVWNFANDAVTGNMTLYAKWIKLQANIFASELKASAVSAENDVDLSYTLNADAASVTITVSNGDEFLITNAADLTKGKHTVKRRLVAPTAAGDYTWSVTAVGIVGSTNTGSTSVKFTDDTETLMHYYSSRGGIAMDKNMDSEFFGRLYISESLAGTTSNTGGRTTQEGVYILNAALQDVTGQGNVSYNGGQDWQLNGAGGADMSPYRISVAPDGRVFLPKYWSNPGLWIMNPANPSDNFTSAFGNTDIYNRPIQSHLIDNDLYLFEQIGETGSVDYRIVRFQDFSAGHTAEGTVITTDSRINNNFSSCVPDGNGGWWVVQNRGGDDVPSVLHFAKDGTYNFGALRSEIGDMSISRGAVAYNVDKKLLALGTSTGASATSVVRVYHVNWTGDVPALGDFYTIPSGGTNTDGLEFDPSNNLYLISTTSERLTGWALPNAKAADNTFTTSAPSSQLISIPNIATSCTVTFMDGSTELSKETVNNGDKATKPSPDPVREGYTFGGWFTEEDYEWKFDTDLITGHTTLFAKWTKNSYIVTFNSHSGTPVASVSVEHGGKLTKPDDPTREGYTFKGWYMDENYTFVWIFDTDIVTSDIVLHAKWEATSTGYEIAEIALLRIYPNPTDGILILEFEEAGNYIVTLSDMSGKKILTQQLSEQVARLDISAIPNGVYLLVISDGDRQTVTRIVKQ